MSEKSEPTDSLPQRILVVDDNAMNREMLVDFVGMIGYECREACNGSEAMAIIREWLPDTVLLDNQMPGMDGMQVLDVLSQSEDLRHIPVILLSGVDDLQTVTRALEAGAVDFMGKPFNPAILRARLSSSLERKALRDRERELLHSLEKSYKDLQASENSRQALTHMIVHDLGNPLSVIKMTAEMMEMIASSGQDAPSDALMRRIRDITSASGSMDMMISSMLDLSKMEAGVFEPMMELIDVRELLQTLQVRFESLAADANMVIDLDADASCRGHADRILLERIVSNLLSNAFKYAEGATNVWLSSRAANEHLEIVVADNGRGIPEHLHARVFDTFYQVEARDEGAPRTGVGLGLAFCHMAAEVQGGSIRVENNAPHGTRFVLTLPGG